MDAQTLAWWKISWQFFPDTDPRRLDINSIVEICPEVEKCEVTGKTPFSLGGWG